VNVYLLFDGEGIQQASWYRLVKTSLCTTSTHDEMWKAIERTPSHSKEIKRRKARIVEVFNNKQPLLKMVPHTHTSCSEEIFSRLAYLIKTMNSITNHRFLSYMIFYLLLEVGIISVDVVAASWLVNVVI
jgi:hypothetical protein